MKLTRETKTALSLAVFVVLPIVVYIANIPQANSFAKALQSKGYEDVVISNGNFWALRSNCAYNAGFSAKQNNQEQTGLICKPLFGGFHVETY